MNECVPFVAVENDNNHGRITRTLIGEAHAALVEPRADGPRDQCRRV
jgi:hypothetical protein